MTEIIGVVGLLFIGGLIGSIVTCIAIQYKIYFNQDFRTKLRNLIDEYEDGSINEQ